MVPKNPRQPKLALRSRSEVLVRLGTRLRLLREERGISQEALADLAGVDRTYVSGIERGIRNVTVLSLNKLAQALGVSLAVLFAEL